MYLLFTVFFLQINKDVFSQNGPAEFLQSPNAASLGIYGSNQISPFTGLPDIKFNVFSLKYGDVPIVADLQYFGGGVKPESHPGWVGQNWTLNVGGIITRKKNVGPDEVVTDSRIPQNAFSYLDRYNHLDDPNWYTDTFIQNYFNQSSSYPALLAPDEFSFILANGLSGSFYLNHKNVWTVKSGYPGKLEVQVETNSAPFRLVNPINPSNYTDIKRIIYKITITDDKGTKYTFGNDASSIEFVRGQNNTNLPNNEHIIANSWYLTKIESPRKYIVNFVYERKEAQLHQSVSFYSSNISFTSYAYNKYGANGTISPRYPLNYGSQVINPCYLKEINSEIFVVKFNKSVTDELKCVYDGPAFTQYNIGDLGTTFGSSTIPTYYKIDNIEIYNKTIPGTLVLADKHYFTYNNISTERLFLKSFYSLMGSSEKKEYKFEYNSIALPAYNARKVDLWGYYNNTSYPTNQALTATQFLSYLQPDTALMKAGSLIKIIYPTGGYTNIIYESNDYSKKIEKVGKNVNLISSIGYGGGIRIRKMVDYDNNGKASSKEYFYKNSSGLSSGILGTYKDVTYNFTISNPAMVTGNIITNNSFLDLDYTHGREVVYSEVKEVLSDSSYVVYNYSNSDNSNYIDEPPVNIYSNSVFLRSNGNTLADSYDLVSSYSHPLLSLTSRELERGNLLSKKTFTSSGKLVHQLKNKFRSDLARFDEYVRCYINYSASLEIPLNPGFYISNENYYQAMKVYTYFPYIEEQTETQYSNVTNDSISVTKKYQYDHNYRLVKQETITGSNSNIIKTTFKYPFNSLPSGDGVLEAMMSKNMSSYLLEKKIERNDHQTELISTKYYSPSTGIYAPRFIVMQKKNTEPLDTIAQYISYDLNGNLLSEKNLAGINTSYKWNYFKTLPLMKITNASQNEFFYEGFEYGFGPGFTGGHGASSYTVNWTRPNNKEYVISYWYWTNADKWRYKAEQPYTSTQFVLTGAEGYDDIRIYPKDANMETFTYIPLIESISSITGANGLAVFYSYDELHRLKSIKNDKGEILKSYNYHYKGQ